MNLLLHAPNVHQGGGRTLLLSLLESIPPDLKVALIVDRRMVLPSSLGPNVSVVRVQRTVPARLRAEQSLRSLADSASVVLCLGNLPPLFKAAGRVYLFVQNRFLCEALPLRGFPMATRLRIRIERLWLRAFLGNADQIIVQSPAMRARVRAGLGVDPLVMPFARNASGYRRSSGAEAKQRSASDSQFLYVASGEPHKNHAALIDAWRILAQEGIRPTLHLTLEPSGPVALLRQIETARREFGANIVLHGGLDAAGVAALYRRADALIYPSATESLGLPLIEARVAGIPILAAELDYVRDCIDPEQSFDPHSAQSMTRAVKRFLGIAEAPLPLLEPAEFLRRILDR